MWPRKRKQKSPEDTEEEFRKTALEAIESLVSFGKPKDISDVLKFIRTECHFEMNQIGVRLTWLLAAQTFLLSAVVIAISNALNQNTHAPGLLAVLACLVSLVGITISLRNYQILYAAMWTIDRWHERKRTLINLTLEKNICGEYHVLTLGRWLKENDPIHQQSLKFAKLIPWVFFSFWAFLFFSSVWLACILPFGLGHHLANGS